MNLRLLLRYDDGNVETEHDQPYTITIRFLVLKRISLMSMLRTISLQFVATSHPRKLRYFHFSVDSFSRSIIEISAMPVDLFEMRFSMALIPVLFVFHHLLLRNLHAAATRMVFFASLSQNPLRKKPRSCKLRLEHVKFMTESLSLIQFSS